jgi:hypothetical protein
MNHHSTRQLLTAFSLAAALAVVAACSGPSSSLSPTAPTGVAAAATGGANFSPNPNPPLVCERPAPWVDSGDGSGTCVCPEPNIFDPTADTCTPPPPPPPPGVPCSPGYWKNHETEFATYCGAAAALPGDSFATCADLFAALTCRGSDASCGRHLASGALNTVSACVEDD